MTLEEILRMGEAILASNIAEGRLFTMGGTGPHTELSVWERDAGGEWCQVERHERPDLRKQPYNALMGELYGIIAARGSR